MNWYELKWAEVKSSLKSEMNCTEPNATELNWLWIEKERQATKRRDANTSARLIQSGHTFLQIILLIIPERSIAALNQTELWVHSLCLWPSNTAALCDSRRERLLTSSIFPLFHPLCSLRCMPLHLSQSIWLYSRLFSLILSNFNFLLLWLLIFPYLIWTKNTAALDYLSPAFHMQYSAVT